MSIKPIIYLPDPILRPQRQPVERVDQGLSSFIEDMIETMYDAPGIDWRRSRSACRAVLLVIDVAGKDEPNNPQVFINPELCRHRRRHKCLEEGCLSIPNY